MLLPAKSPAIAWPESVNPSAMREFSTCASLMLTREGAL